MLRLALAGKIANLDENRRAFRPREDSIILLLYAAVFCAGGSSHVPLDEPRGPKAFVRYLIFDIEKLEPVSVLVGAGVSVNTDK